MSTNSKLKLSFEAADSFNQKNWDSFNYIFWGISSIMLGLIILEFFILNDLWTITLIFKVLLFGVGFIAYAYLRPKLSSPNWIILCTLVLSSAYFFTIIQLTEGFKITLLFAILSIVIGFSNYLLLWKVKFSFFEVSSIITIFFLIQYNDNFNSFNNILQLGGYSFFLVLILSAFIPDARKKNYFLNLERELLKEKLISRQQKKLNSTQIEISELKEILKINSENEKIIRHDLKNKFTNIIGLSQLIEIKDGKITEEDQSYLQLLKEVSKDLLRYSDNVFNQSDSQDGSSLRMSIKKVYLSRSFQKVQKELIPKLDLQGINLLVIEENKESYILADFLVFNTILENILNYLIGWSTINQNVIISSMELTENIRIELTAPSAKISSGDLNNIFKPLENFEFHSSFSTPKGLGLQIAKSMTERMGGYFKFQTDEMDGVVFKIEFPKTTPQ
ncbi:MAG: signal transduction histidine kinase [Algoriphagus sp.]|jgi:signal transduction histidine kinase